MKNVEIVPDPRDQLIAELREMCEDLLGLVVKFVPQGGPLVSQLRERAMGLIIRSAPPTEPITPADIAAHDAGMEKMGFKRAEQLAKAKD